MSQFSDFHSHRVVVRGSPIVTSTVTLDRTLYADIVDDVDCSHKQSSDMQPLLGIASIHSTSYCSGIDRPRL
jgi:hypothetical protein